MLKKDMSKLEIEETIKQRGDFANIGDLTRLLKEDISIDMKKFLCKKLADIYERKSLFNDAAKMYNNLAIISVAFVDKIRHHIKEAEIYIKTGDFQKVEEAMTKAMNQANSVEKNEIYITIKHAYKKQAEVYTKEKKRNHASKIYEKLMEMKISHAEREEYREKLMQLYDKLGKFQEYAKLKREET